ncbi:MAG: hypothetical protein C3F08_04075 [Candidatus Methylomirabilota bacterium]|nr:MAG: hypothetical protein C3F08_04075 [candidate division NC10 bacterium]
MRQRRAHEDESRYRARTSNLLVIASDRWERGNLIVFEGTKNGEIASASPRNDTGDFLTNDDTCSADFFTELLARDTRKEYWQAISRCKVTIG